MARGFTLLELLISIAIFSMLGLGAYQLLQTVTRSHDHLQEGLAVHRQFNLAMSIMQRDFNQFVPRVVRDEYGEPLVPIMFDSGEYVIEFTRQGWRNPAGKVRSNLQRVAYSIDYDTRELTRHFWQVLDRAEDSEPVSQVLLAGVNELMITGYAADDADLESDFSLDGGSSVLPLAVEVVLTLEQGGDVTRIFQLVDTPVAGRDDRQVDEQPDSEAEEQPGSEAEEQPQDESFPEPEAE